MHLPNWSWTQRWDGDTLTGRILTLSDNASTYIFFDADSSQILKVMNSWTIFNEQNEFLFHNNYCF